MTGAIAFICALFGLVIGSFLNVVIWRVPRHESVVAPPSHCPGCDTPIAPRDNIPVVSWLLLRGRCRHCGTSIAVRYPLIELLTASLFAAVGARFSDSWVLPAYLVLTAGLIALSAIDFEHYLLPNRVLYPTGFISGALLVVGSGLEGEWGALLRAILGALAAFLFFFTIHLIAPGGMAFGDVRLSFLLGLFLGWLGWGYVVGGLFTGFLLGAVVGVALIAAGKGGRKTKVPFGPFLATGAMIFILFGGPIVDWYTNLMN
jgi:leader peptidase (prepilin peptidase) / N-methyltransferase